VNENAGATVASQSVYAGDAFSRADESEDAVFYGRDRFVQHLDAAALATVSWAIGKLVVEEAPVILDLLASWDSHLPDGLRPAEVVGLGLNERELARNPALDRYVLGDLNRDPSLPFEEGRFDAALCTVSVDYLTRPFAVFPEVARVLKPGGLFAVIFSNRFFPEKAVKVWREASEAERVLIVEDYFRSAPSFGPCRVYLSKGRPRPAENRYAGLGLPSDPVYVAYAEKAGAPPERKARPVLREDRVVLPDEALVNLRKGRARETLECPYCGVRMKKWAVPVNPFTEWDREFLYVCFNDECPLIVRGWGALSEQGNQGFSYRTLYDPVSFGFFTVPVPSNRALREGIVEE
jgi:SAM-dependent methyltransferase